MLYLTIYRELLKIKSVCHQLCLPEEREKLKSHHWVSKIVCALLTSFHTLKSSY